ncbi:F510_1955 family glycosylhydrolase [Scopulibacillus cellulosilyticus]|uniref:F510_1955 family glycosylhydrolase n=1 Tax=Scopulibacillus cellulosilyticus TaxID=2665665 RepID=A0ABW2PYN8_9BACL
MTKNTDQTANGPKKGFGGLFIIVIIFIVIIAAWFLYLHHGSQNKTVGFKQIYGLGYSSNGKSLYVPVHDGLAVYMNGEWKKQNAEKNDYVGFSMTDDGFYSSGHSGENSKHPDPLGIIKVTNTGKNIKTLGFSGKTNFQIMGVGYYSHAIYVFNPNKNSKMPTSGLYYSLNDGKSWTKSDAKGLIGKPQAIAVHPKNKSIVAVGTDQGLFISKDNGKIFKTVFTGKNVTGLLYGFDGFLYAGAFTDQSEMDKVDLSTGNITSLELSSVEQDPIKYMTQNPKDQKQMVISTQKNDVYTTESAGQNWVVLAKGGKGLFGK